MSAKNSFVWDWENLVMSNTAKEVEAPKQLQLVDSDVDGIEGFELVGCFYSSGSDLGYAYAADSSKSLKSGSVDSLGERGIKGANFVLETNTQTSSSTVTGESLIALHLGKRTFFEDVPAVNNSAKKPKPSSSTMDCQIPRCQAEGCNLDLSSAKDYHRKHRVCEHHSKCPKVVIKGVERRFCQQCSRFHEVSEFDEKKRSCRRRLTDHNARRRKPKPDVIQFNSLYEGRNQLSFGFSQDSLSISKDTLVKPHPFTITNPATSDELRLGQNPLQNPAAGNNLSPISAHFLPTKATPSGLLHQGLEVSMESSPSPEDARALSLLSTNTWGSSPFSPNAIKTMPLSSDNYWHCQQPQVSSNPSSRTSTFQLFKPPNQSSFYLY